MRLLTGRVSITDAFPFCFCDGGKQHLGLYVYNGPIMLFDRCVTSMWRGETIADTEKKAKSNLAYQYKKQNNLVPRSKITLPGNVNLVG